MKSLKSNALIQIFDKITNTSLGTIEIKLKDFTHQHRVEKLLPLKNSIGTIRLRVRLFWSKLTFFQKEIINAEEKLQMATKEKRDLMRYLQVLDEPFGIIVYGEVNNIIDNDILEVPKEKEEIIEKQRLSVLPRASVTGKPRLSRSFIDRIDNTLGSTFSKSLYYFIQINIYYLY